MENYKKFNLENSENFQIRKFQTFAIRKIPQILKFRNSSNF